MVEVKHVSQLVKFLLVLKNSKVIIEHLNVSDPTLYIRDAKWLTHSFKILTSQWLERMETEKN